MKFSFYGFSKIFKTFTRVLISGAGVKFKFQFFAFVHPSPVWKSRLMTQNQLSGKQFFSGIMSNIWVGKIVI